MNNSGELILIIAAIAAIGLTLGLMRISRQYLRRNPYTPADGVKPVKLGEEISPTFTFLRLIAHRIPPIKIKAVKIAWPRIAVSWPVVIEILLVILWAIYAGRQFLDFDPTYWPRGNEFSLSVRDNYFWQDLTRCGSCAFWDGRTAGGFPALVDLQGAPLHPLFIFPTLLFGVIDGGKVAVVLGLALAGLAQLWLGYVMGLGRVARLWAAGMAVVAGTITGRMELGLTTLVVSTASGALVIPAGIYLAQKRSWRAAILLAGALALTMLAGQGYLQLGVLLAILPALLILYLGTRERTIDLFKKLLFAGWLAALVCGIMLFPLAHNSPAIVKDTDPDFKMAQPIDYQLLNLVIHDETYYHTEILGKAAYPYVFSNYIGWTPILFALFALLLVPAQKYRLVIFFLVGIALLYLNSSMILPKLLFTNVANDFLIGMRNSPLMIGLAGPLILGLAAWGLDLALKVDWLVIGFNWKFGAVNNIRLNWVILAILMVISILSVNQFNAAWLDTVKVSEGDSQAILQIKPATTQWVELPEENFWNLFVFENDMKLTNAFHPWHFKDKEIPGGMITGVREDETTNVANAFLRSDGLAFVKNPSNDYSSMVLKDYSTISCPADAQGGWIEVYCPDNIGGELVVKEHNWSGWTAYVDGQAAPMVMGEWLKLYLPAGSHTVSFRYQPWDIILGLLASLAGIGVAGIVWRRDRG